MPVAASSIADPAAESEAFHALLLLAERRTGRIPPIASSATSCRSRRRRAGRCSAPRSKRRSDGSPLRSRTGSWSPRRRLPAWAHSQLAARAPLLGRTRFSSSRSSRCGRAATAGTSSATRSASASTCSPFWRSNQRRSGSPEQVAAFFRGELIGHLGALAGQKPEEAVAVAVREERVDGGSVPMADVRIKPAITLEGKAIDFGFMLPLRAA